MNVESLNPSQTKIHSQIIKSLQRILTQKLDRTGFVKMSMNEIRTLLQTFTS